MTELEQQLLENLTKQLDTHNKIELRRMQNSSIWEDKLHNTEIEYLIIKKRLFKTITDFIFVLGIVAIVILVLLGISFCRFIF